MTTSFKLCEYASGFCTAFFLLNSKYLPLNAISLFAIDNYERKCLEN